MRGAGICFLEATELARLIRVRELSSQEVTAACLEQIERTNPHVNAIVTLVPERAMRDARAADEILAEAFAYGEDVGPLHGLPVAHKDLAPTLARHFRFLNRRGAFFGLSSETSQEHGWPGVATLAGCQSTRG